MKKTVIALLLLFASFASADLIVGPSSWNATQSASTTFALISTENNSIPVTITLSGSAAPWITLDKVTLLLPPNSADTIKATLLVPAIQATGTYTANLTFTGFSGSTQITKNIPVTINVTGIGTNYPFNQQVLVQQGQRLSINPQGYNIDLVDISTTNLTINAYYGNTIEKRNAQIDILNPLNLTNGVRLRLIQLYPATQSSILEVGAYEPNTLLSLTQSPSNAAGSLEVIPTSHIIYKKNSESDYTITETITNKYIKPVTLKTLILQPEGAAWLHLGTFDLKTLQPAESMTIPVILSPASAPTGTTKAQLQIYGELGTQTVNTTITYSITIAEDQGNPSNANLTQTVAVPTFIAPNSPFFIQVNGVLPSDGVTPEFTPAEGVTCQPNSVQTIAGVWTAQCLSSNSGVFKLLTRIYRKNVPIFAQEKTLLVGFTLENLDLTFNPPLENGVTSVISVSVNGTVLRGAKISINGVNSPDNTVLPLSGQTYKICADVGLSTQKCSDTLINKTKATVSYNPLYPTPGSTVTLSATDQRGQIIQNPSFVVNNAPIQGNSFRVGEGTYIVTLANAQYDTATATINAKNYVTSNQSALKEGDSTTLTFSDVTPYEVHFNNGNMTQDLIIAQGTAASVTLPVPNSNYSYLQAGTYSVYTKGTNFYSFPVQKRELWETNWFTTLLEIAIVILIATIVYFGFRKLQGNQTPTLNNMPFTMGTGGSIKENIADLGDGIQ